jgi:hypothetical protein
LLVAGSIRDLILGQAEGARIMARAAALQAIHCQLLDSTFVPPTGFDNPIDGIPLVVHANPDRMAVSLEALRHRISLRRRVIGYWAWELEVVPAVWRRALRFVHEIWVPSSFVAGAIAKILPHDGSLPLRVVPHAVATVHPRPSAMDRAAFGLPADAVVILVSLNLASNFARKNPLGAIAAFRQAFGNRSDRILLLKLGSTADWPVDLSMIRDAVEGAENIRIETRPLQIADNHALTVCADIVLSLHRSEGFGLVLAEAMMLEKALVATG